MEKLEIFQQAVQCISHFVVSLLCRQGFQVFLKALFYERFRLVSFSSCFRCGGSTVCVQSWYQTHLIIVYEWDSWTPELDTALTSHFFQEILLMNNSGVLNVKSVFGEKNR